MVGTHGAAFLQRSLPVLVSRFDETQRRHHGFREIEKFNIRQPPKGEKDDYDSENSWMDFR